MRNASRILLKIGFIVGIVICVIFLIVGIIMLATGTASIEQIKQAIESGSVETNMGGTLDEQAEAIKAVALVTGILFTVLAILEIPAIIVAQKARNKDQRGIQIAAIVLGFLSGNEFIAIGGILGTIAIKN